MAGQQKPREVPQNTGLKTMPKNDFHPPMVEKRIKSQHFVRETKENRYYRIVKSAKRHAH